MAVSGIVRQNSALQAGPRRFVSLPSGIGDERGTSPLSRRNSSHSAWPSVAPVQSELCARAQNTCQRPGIQIVCKNDECSVRPQVLQFDPPEFRHPLPMPESPLSRIAQPAAAGSSLVECNTEFKFHDIDDAEEFDTVSDAETIFASTVSDSRASPCTDSRASPCTDSRASPCSYDRGDLPGYNFKHFNGHAEHLMLAEMLKPVPSDSGMGSEGFRLVSDTHSPVSHMSSELSANDLNCDVEPLLLAEMSHAEVGPSPLLTGISYHSSVMESVDGQDVSIGNMEGSVVHMAYPPDENYLNCDVEPLMLAEMSPTESVGPSPLCTGMSYHSTVMESFDGQDVSIENMEDSVVLMASPDGENNLSCDIEPLLLAEMSPAESVGPSPLCTGLSYLSSVMESVDGQDVSIENIEGSAMLMAGPDTFQSMTLISPWTPACWSVLNTPATTSITGDPAAAPSHFNQWPSEGLDCNAEKMLNLDERVCKAVFKGIEGLEPLNFDALCTDLDHPVLCHMLPTSTCSSTCTYSSSEGTPSCSPFGLSGSKPVPRLSCSPLGLAAGLPILRLETVTEDCGVTPQSSPGVDDATETVGTSADQPILTSLPPQRPVRRSMYCPRSARHSTERSARHSSVSV